MLNVSLKTNILVILQHVYVNAVISTKLPTVDFSVVAAG